MPRRAAQGRNGIRATAGARRSGGPRHMAAPKRSWGRIVIAALAVAALIVTSFVVVQLVRIQQNISTAPLNLGTDGASQLPVDTSTDPLQILVLGTDTRGSEAEGYGNSDVMMLLNLSADRQRVTVLSFPRDLMVPVPSCKDPVTGEVSENRTRAQLNGALTQGGPGCTVAAINQLTGLKIDHFMMADFDAVKELSTTLGGVEVCVTDAVDDPKSELRLPAGVSTIQGDQALAFLRTRHGFGNGGDEGRIRAQQSFLASMARKVASEGTLTNLPRLYAIADTVTRNLTVDEGLNNVTSLLTVADRLRAVDLEKVAFVTVPVVTDPADTNRLVLDESPAQALFNILRSDGDVTVPGGGTASAAPSGAAAEGTPAPSASSAPASAAPTAASAAPTAAPAPPAFSFRPAAVPVTVANGSGAEGRGTELTALLTSLGFSQARTEEVSTTYTSTQLLYSSGYAEIAREVAARFAVPDAQVQQSSAVRGLSLAVGADFTSGTQLPPVAGIGGGITGQTAAQETCQAAAAR